MSGRLSWGWGALCFGSRSLQILDGQHQPALLQAWPGHSLRRGFLPAQFYTSLLYVKLKSRIESKVLSLCCLEGNFPNLHDPFCWCSQVLHRGAGRLLKLEPKGNSLKVAQAVLLHLQILMVQEKATGPGQVCVRLLGNPCLGFLQRAVQSRSTENACSHLMKWQLISYLTPNSLLGGTEL